MSNNTNLEKKNMINDNESKQKSDFFDFITPAMATKTGILISALFSLALLFVIPFFGLLVPLNSVSANLLLLGCTQLIGFFVVRFGMIPLFKSNELYHESLSLLSFRTMFMGIVVGYCIAIASNLLFITIFGAFGITPQTGYGAILLTEEIFKDPLTLALYFLVPTLGAGVFEELIYRRMVIPLLEERGMSPKAAVFASAFIFALSHLPNDLINGNLAGGIVHVWGVFVIGALMGIVYVITRNVIYPMIMHAIYNLISFLGPYVLITENLGLLALYGLLVMAIIGSGVLITLFLLIEFLRHHEKRWTQILRIKSPIDIKKGFLGYLIITTIVLMALFVIDLTFTILIYAGYNFVTIIIFYIIILAALSVMILWIGHKYRMRAVLNDIKYT